MQKLLLFGTKPTIVGLAPLSQSLDGHADHRAHDSGDFLIGQTCASRNFLDQFGDGEQTVLVRNHLCQNSLAQCGVLGVQGGGLLRSRRGSALQQVELMVDIILLVFGQGAGRAWTAEPAS